MNITNVLNNTETYHKIKTPPTSSHTFGPYLTKITQTYLVIRAINIGRKCFTIGKISPGKIDIYIDRKGQNEFISEGTLNANGSVSGMAKLFSKMNVKENDELRYSIAQHEEETRIKIFSEQNNLGNEQAVSQLYKSVFNTQNFNHIHIEAFRPENLNNWEPETETDVFMAFGVLEKFTDYKYCCGVSSDLLKKLGANYNDKSKPDAILISKVFDGQYLMAEWKKKSSDFKTNHLPEDVDVLVCWHDDELNRAVLPPNVLCLHTIARLVATAIFAPD